VQRNRHICDAAIARVRELVPPAELRYAFIAGSRAGGDPRPDSDVDYVVVLNRPSRFQEISVAQAMRDIHRAHALQDSHCGEIISLPTLDNMLSATPQLRHLIEIGYLECACFGADCILSIARKFLVVLHMLAGHKSHVMGDVNALKQDTSRASLFFESLPGFRFPKSPQVLDWTGTPSDSTRFTDWRRFTGLIQPGDLLDTPVGVSLERWFSNTIAHPAERLRDEDHAVRLGAITPGKCPLEQLPAQQGLRRVIQVQCISP